MASDIFDLVASEPVVTESAAGDTDAARARLEVLESITLLDVTEETGGLGQRLLTLGAVPRQAAADAARIANATMRLQIERVCRQAGYEPPVICTPDELLEVGHADGTG